VIVVAICLADFDAYIPSFDKAGVLQSLTKGGHPNDVYEKIRSETRQNTDHLSRFFGTYPGYPGRRPADEPYELPTFSLDTSRKRARGR